MAGEIVFEDDVDDDVLSMFGGDSDDDDAEYSDEEDDDDDDDDDKSIREKKSQIVGELSGGQRQQVALGRALMTKPSVLMLDEPTAGLDWSIRDEILRLIKQLSKEQYKIIVTHEPEIFSSWNISNYQLKPK